MVLINDDWKTERLHYATNFLPPRFLSDHCLGVVEIFQTQTCSIRYFKFFNMWISHPEFNTIVEQAWNNSSIEGTQQFILCKKLTGLKQPLKNLNALHFSHISSRAKEASEALKHTQRRLDAQPNNIQLRTELSSRRDHASFLAEAERQFYAQKAKIRHLNLADKGTKFFHSLVKRNSQKSLLPQSPAVMAHLPSHLIKLQVNFTLTDEAQLYASRPILDNDIKAALFAIRDDKAPRPNGFFAAFFKKSWNIVSPSVCAAVQEFLYQGKLLK
ncbi:hypothetical protein C2S52_013486 [Perilla frutescens var. hirtella]|nr:hypothetical protein C2S52_013486 [Perilla frutescens var. hirtella]